MKLKLDSVPFSSLNAPVKNNDFIDNNDNSFSSDSMPDDEAELALMLMEKFNDCSCCKGDVYNCKDPTCVNLGACYCLIQD